MKKVQTIWLELSDLELGSDLAISILAEPVDLPQLKTNIKVLSHKIVSNKNFSFCIYVRSEKQNCNCWLANLEPAFSLLRYPSVCEHSIGCFPHNFGSCIRIRCYLCQKNMEYIMFIYWGNFNFNNFCVKQQLFASSNSCG